ncbi:hypothetical protein PSTG_07931 [Puccinia striiformis f. sp. tritici PST-78]|uniref:Ig-like domain-containing protein n=1 Tax=Puccinia striiformis f. sp. tritici PST-78 TaxID=1165861 RepID=A0A0L0VIB5_9BASI|nr:hypothetical protein PSTG_07931 [Puccinia striiformis f. sp. tritici PST-78]
MLVVLTTLCVFLSSATQSLAWLPPGPNLVKTGHFQMGQTNVTFCYPRVTPDGVTILKPANKVESSTPVSLTPVRCNRFECRPPTSDPPELFTWTQLGLDFINIIEKCVLPHTGSKGGSCMFDSYMGYNFTNPALELQTWSDEANFLESH